MKAEEARQKAAALVNKWMESVYGDAIEDGGFSVILRDDEGRKHMQLLEEWIAAEILAAKAEERGIEIAQCEGCGEIFDPESPDARAGWHEVMERVSGPGGEPEPAQAQCGPISKRDLFSADAILAAQREAEAAEREGCAATMERFRAGCHGIWAEHERSWGDEMAKEIRARPSAYGDPQEEANDEG